METRNSRILRPRKLWRIPFRGFASPFLLSVFLVIGCGAPGDPVAPAPQIPTPITDLVAAQSGDAVLLTFTLPDKTLKGERLLVPPAVEILRGTLKPDGTADPKSFREIFTIPGAMVENYRSADQLHFLDHISPEDLRAANSAFVYRVRTRASRKRSSADSNSVVQRMLPVPERINSLSATVTESAVELTWQPPAKTSDGAPLPGVAEYRIYRGQLDPSSSVQAGSDLSQAKWISPLTFLSSSTETSFRDTNFDFGKTYLYTVRTSVMAGAKPVESSDSSAAVVTARDTFPPAVPQGVVANVVIPTDAPVEVDLSWSINLEPDLSGYRIYRSEQQDMPAQLLTPELLLSPAYRDTSVQPGHHYWYYVTSLDRSGNESARSAPVAVDIAQPSS